MFNVMWSSQDAVYGPAGNVHLTLSVPAGKTVTIFKGRSVRVGRFDGSVNIFASQNVELEEVTGDVYLFHTHAHTIRRVKGRVVQRMYGFGGANYSNQHARHYPPWEQTIEDVEGSVDIDVGRAAITAANLTGDVRIRNHFGATELRQDCVDDTTRIRLETKSGRACLSLPEGGCAGLHVAGIALSGSVKYDQAKPLPLYCTKNDSYSIMISTTWDLSEVRCLLAAESGDVEIRTLKREEDNPQQ